MMTIAQASKMTNVSPRGLRAACASGRIPGAQRIGRDWIIPTDGLKKYMMASRAVNKSKMEGRVEEVEVLV